MKRNSHKYDNVDLSGKRHERLVAISKAENTRTQWVCLCDCGNTVVIPAFKFFQNKSCGCLEDENRKSLRERATTHGMTETRLYSQWCGIKERCYNPHYKHFERYGGRGIRMCEEWRNSFENFRNWAILAGYDGSLNGREQSIDRIDVNGNYEPSNCRWVSMLQQARNRQDTVKICVDGKEIPAREFAETNNITDYVLLFRWIKNGFSAEQILKKWEMLRSTPNNYMTIKEAAVHYGVCDCTIRQWIKNGKLKSEKYGQKVYVIK